MLRKIIQQAEQIIPAWNGSLHAPFVYIAGANTSINKQNV